jgi:ankyrin repeat protein
MMNANDLRAHLMAGDFSLLEPHLTREVIEPLDPPALAEALTCAAWLGRADLVEWLLGRGVPPAGGNATGMSALHWAASRGQLGAVQLLLQHRAPLETHNMYGGTVLGQTVWSAIHEPRDGQLEAIEMLLDAGADRGAVELPTGDERIDALLRRPG